MFLRLSSRLLDYFLKFTRHNKSLGKICTMGRKLYFKRAKMRVIWWLLLNRSKIDQKWKKSRNGKTIFFGENENVRPPKSVVGFWVKWHQCDYYIVTNVIFMPNVTMWLIWLLWSICPSDSPKPLFWFRSKPKPKPKSFAETETRTETLTETHILSYRRLEHCITTDDQRLFDVFSVIFE